MSGNNLNHTHDARRKSWVASANAPGCDFPLQNLPFGVFGHRDGEPRAAVAIGNQVLDLEVCLDAGLLNGDAAEATEACVGGILNGLMALGSQYWSALRAQLFDLLAEGCADADRAKACMTPMSDVHMRLPASIGDYTDFYASIHHATRVGEMFRPGNPLLPNYKHLPVAYHGRTSSVVASGADVRRPYGQLASGAGAEFAPTRQLDYELELGLFVGTGNELGERVQLDAAEEHLFGVCLLNDWSARDVQTWESQPLGPFLAKNFATTISPWVVTMEALAPFRAAAAARAEGDPPLLPHLDSKVDRESGGIEVELEVWLRTERMRSEGAPPQRLSQVDFREMYWTPGQMVAHHTSNGCNLRPGDLLGSGTVSGADPASSGCLLERTRRGQEPIALQNGERRGFLEDGDEVIFRGRCEREAFAAIGFGECSGRVVAAR